MRKVYGRQDARFGFTIVELLIVIVVIGILAAITIVAYNGIQAKAQVAALQTDLESAAKLLTSDYYTNGYFPSATPTLLNGSPQAANGGKGLQASNGATYQYVTINGGYCLAEANATTSYYVTNSKNTPSVGICSTLSGLVGWWPFNSNTADQSGYGDDGVNSGATLTSGQNGQANGAYSFDGASSQIVVADAPQLDMTGAQTISVWINPSSNAAIIKGILSKDISGGLSNPAYSLQLTASGNLISYNTTNASNSYQSIASNAVATTGSWTLLTGVYNGTTMYLYINGVLYGSTVTQTNVGATSAPLRIGQQKNGSGRWFNGSIDDVRVYNRALSSSEVAALYAAGAQ